MRPSSLICKRWICDYCDSPAFEEKWATGYQYGIISCPSHSACAQRDIRAFYHRREQVLVEDLLEFSPELARVQKNISWADDTGVQKQGGVICRSAPIRCSFASSFRGQMAIPLDIGGIIRPLHVKDLINTDGITRMGLDALLEKLAAGFYKDMYEAHLAAPQPEPRPILAFWEHTVAGLPKPVPKLAVVESKEEMLARLTRVESVARAKKQRRSRKKQNESESEAGQSQTMSVESDDNDWITVK